MTESFSWLQNHKWEAKYVTQFSKMLLEGPLLQLPSFLDSVSQYHIKMPVNGNGLRGHLCDVFWPEIYHVLEGTVCDSIILAIIALSKESHHHHYHHHQHHITPSDQFTSSPLSPATRPHYPSKITSLPSLPSPSQRKCVFTHLVSPQLPKQAIDSFLDMFMEALAKSDDKAFVLRIKSTIFEKLLTDWVSATAVQHKKGKRRRKSRGG